MSKKNAQKETFQLILAGPRDNTPELLDQLRYSLGRELNLAIDAVTKLLESAPITIAQATDTDKLEILYDRLKSAGARVFILRTTRLSSRDSSTGTPQSDRFSLSLDRSFHHSQSADSIEYDSPNEQLSSLLGQLRKNALIDEWCNVEEVASEDTTTQKHDSNVTFWDVPSEWNNLEESSDINSPVRLVPNTATSKRDK